MRTAGSEPPPISTSPTPEHLRDLLLHDVGDRVVDLLRRARIVEVSARMMQGASDGFALR